MKPFGLNFWTVSFFLPSAALGVALECPQVAWGSAACCLTGWLYHGTYHVVFLRVDQLVLSFCVLYFTITGRTATWHYCAACVCLLILVVGYFTLSHHRLGVLFHSALHLISNVGICMLIVGCVRAGCPLHDCKNP